MAEGLAMLATLLIGGALADRYQRRTLMIVSDLARFGVVGALAVTDATGNLSFPLLVVFAVGVGLGDGFFHPAFGGIVPLVVEARTLASANALIGTSRWGSFVVGPALAASIYAPAGSATVFALDAVTFLFAAALLWRARPRAVERTVGEGTMREIADGIRYVAGITWLWMTIALAAVVLMIGFAPFQSLFPTLVEDHFKRGVGSYGALFALQSVGMVVGTLVFGQTNPRRHRVLLTYGSWALNDVCVIILILSSSLELAAVLMAMRGFFIGFGVALWETLLMELVPEDKLSRVVSLDFFGSWGLTPVGYGLTAILSGFFTPRAILLGGFSLALVLWVSALSLRRVRSAA
jgi:MFS family permease